IAAALLTRPSPTIFSSWTARIAEHPSFWPRTPERSAKRSASSAGRSSTCQWRAAPRGRSPGIKRAGAIPLFGGQPPAAREFDPGHPGTWVWLRLRVRPPLWTAAESDEILQGRGAQDQKNQKKHRKEKRRELKRREGRTRSNPEPEKRRARRHRQEDPRQTEHRDNPPPRRFCTSRAFLLALDAARADCFPSRLPPPL